MSNRYDVKFTTIQGWEVPEGARPYYATFTVDATLIEDYFVNRLFTATQSKHRTGLNEQTTRTFRVYAYQVEAGKTPIDGVFVDETVSAR